MLVSYIAVSTFRNEKRFVSKVVSSVCNQSITPSAYVVVDDGSSDDTGRRARAAGAEVLRLSAPRSPIRGLNQAYAFNKGVAHASKLCPSWSFLLKVDADSLLPPHYVKLLIEKMGKLPNVGVCGGMPKSEKIRLKRVTDGARLYRRKCWDDIGGLDEWTAFDTHALLKASQIGWETRTFQGIKYDSLRKWTSKNLRDWVMTGWVRKSFGFPWWHTWLAAGKNLAAVYPPILGPLMMVFSQPMSPFKEAPNLDQKWIKCYAVWETQRFLGAIAKKAKE